jgi:hypothetical protein
MQGTSTVGAVLQGLHIDDGEVAHRMSKELWLTQDVQRTANAPPALFGLARGVLGALTTAAGRRGSPQAAELAARWAEELCAMRSRAYQLIDDVDSAEALDERRQLRAGITRLAHDAAAALVAVQGGRAMVTSSPEQRWAREALFALVQAQTFATREAFLATFSPA